MAGIVLDGKAIAGRIQQEVAEAVAEMKEKHGVTPGLAAVLVGENPASQMYVKMKRNRCAKVGIESFGYELPADTSQEELEQLVQQLNADPKVHGILVQLPLPDHLDEERVLQAISIDKDVDGFHPINIGRLAMKGREPQFIPATPYGCMYLLHEAEKLVDGFKIEGSDAVVLGRSNIVGMPMALLLIHANATVTVVHSRTEDIPSIVKRSDIVIGAMGRPEMIKGEWFKEGAVAIDVATVKVEDPSAPKGYVWKGDFEFEAAKERVAAITPVPGGVGPMTIAMLLKNTLRAAEIAIEKGVTA
ncbi:MAG TPA: bifunctional 5,10-methylenetetrahydrofolate dehydrogenase/5,10-methenyltetrahydrofolate cyclohydrolase [Chloroflexi bacterium]|nr:bifunctional 5,10-methylenetetrahydrofolate dehydrogenase/5,10-methenyltetrahydrofolate cyclohydrolase [Chloroflexota bacterium]